MTPRRAEDLFMKITFISITAFLALYIFLDPYDSAREPHRPFFNPMVVDGTNIDDTYGCFFLLRAGAGVDIDPSRYAFYVSEKGYSPHKLDLEVRTNDNLGNPTGGDRNGTYDWTVDGELWSGGEYLGFDMPTEDMGIDIVDGNIYEVMIKNPKGVVIFRGSFVYTCQSDL